jgi:CDP-glucose 4,6-dehydratase
MKNNVFRNKTVLITGHTGFKGSWLSLWLSHLGAKVVGISQDIPTSPSNFSTNFVNELVTDYRLDVTDEEGTKSLIESIKPDFVFHLAAQALVRYSYDEPLKTFKTNAIGTANVLEALRMLDNKVIAIMITSDKTYENVEWVWGYRETDQLGGKDPYSASKSMAENVIRSYFNSFYNLPESNVKIGIARAGNVIGGGDWAADRIVPDCMRAWANGDIVDIRSPNSTRPWQHVLEPLSGYLTLAKTLSDDPSFSGEAFNFGPYMNQNYSVSELINEMKKSWNMIQWNDVSDNNNVYEAGLLKLNCDKALSNLNWRSSLSFEETIKMTVEWYKEYYLNKINNQSMYDFTINQILTYIQIADQSGSTWTNFHD